MLEFLKVFFHKEKVAKILKSFTYQFVEDGERAGLVAVNNAN